METKTTGSRARVMIACSRRRRVQPGSRPVLFMMLFGALFSRELIGTARAELIKLRHDLTSGIPSGRAGNIVQGIAAVQNLYQGLARPSNPALDRAHRAFADSGCVFVGKAARSHQNQR